MFGSQLPRGARPYLRFVVGADFDRPRRLEGPFCSPFCPDEDEDCVPEWFREELTAAFEWFRQNVAVPPFRKHRRWRSYTSEGCAAAVCWFRSDAGEALTRMWELATLLRQIDVPARLLRSHDPGEVLWADEHQVVARR